jgi:hypothetical protein
MNSKMVRNFYLLVQMWKKIFMIFHKANKLSSNIFWVHSKTLNVIPYFQDKTSHGRAACFVLFVQVYEIHWSGMLQITFLFSFVCTSLWDPLKWDASDHILSLFEKLLRRRSAWAGSMTFGLVGQKFLNIERFFHRKLN